MDRKKFILVYGIILILALIGTSIFVNIKTNGNPQLTRADKIKRNLGMLFSIVATAAAAVLLYTNS